MRDTVLYVGGFGLPDRTASALRALGNAAVLRLAGYSVVIAGKFAEIPTQQPILVEGFECHDIRQPWADAPRIDYTLSLANVEALIRRIGPERIAAVFAYNYPGFGLHRLLATCQRLRVPLVNESTEWYGWEGFRPVSNLRRVLESRWRNTGLVESAGNFICATEWSRKRHPGVNSLVLPFAMDSSWDCWQVSPNHDWYRAPDEVVRLVYSGSPGLGMHKDRLPLLVEALHRADPEGARLRLAVAGMVQGDYLAQMPGHARMLACISFLGRMPHREAVGVLKSADFSVFVRERNRVSEVGFPTKYAEAATCGIPVLTNRSSDIARYLADGENGILLPDASVASIEAGLRRVAAMTPDAMERMKSRVRRENPFDIHAWVPRMRTFMQDLRMPR